jgi:hypothetical protein
MKSLTKEEAAFCKQVRFKKNTSEDLELVDFFSGSLPQVRDGNTISYGQWLRRGLTKPTAYSQDYQVPQSRNIELVSLVKTNGDVCMFSYVDFEEEDDVDGMFLIATRGNSIIASDKDHLEKSNGTGFIKDIGRLWFEQVARLDKRLLAELKRKLSGKTWVGEYLNGDSLIHYPQGDTILLHAIVDNQTGKQLADADKLFTHFKFATLSPVSHGTFICEESDLTQKIRDINTTILHKPLCESHEGVILQLIDREDNSVIEQVRIKSVEFEMLSYINESLMSSIEQGQIETQMDRLMQNFTK